MFIRTFQVLLSPIFCTCTFMSALLSISGKHDSSDADTIRKLKLKNKKHNVKMCRIRFLAGPVAVFQSFV